MLLDEAPEALRQSPPEAWFHEIERSLEDAPQAWITAIAAIGGLSDEHAWSLLSWIESAASHVVRAHSRDALVTSAFAMALVLQGGLDRRDCSIVPSLLRRAAEIGGLDFSASVTQGCGRAGPLGQEALFLLVHASGETPATHVESGSGKSFSFERRKPDFDVEALERWLEGDGQ
ncbi:hypothetical protein [Micromonospora sp. NPDC051006]|uniref:hypothetical protein n=1 Tax=Micromonospora sp. NPDC051006 TaxID=3364283 RepID=UPI00378B6DD8